MLNETPLRALPDPAEDFAVADCIEDCVAAARGAISDNTERALRSDLGIYAAWCGKRGLAAVPASPATVAAFVDEMAAVRAPATVRRYVASIAAAHRAIGRGRSVRSAAVRLALQRMHRARGRRQGQAQGLTWPLRQRLLEASGMALIDARNRALLAVAYDGMLRRSELSALQVSDVVEEMSGDATLLVRRSKTDQESRGAMVYPGAGHRLDGWGVARPRRHRRWQAVPVAAPGTPAGRAAASEPDPTHFQAHGAARRIAGQCGLRAVRPQRPRGRGAGHDRLGHRVAGHPSGGPLEDHRDGEPLRRPAPGES